jgi:D-sedoheptulose 7-phosphate isomerase
MQQIESSVRSDRDLDIWLGRELDEHVQVFEAARSSIVLQFARFLDLVEISIRSGGKLLLFGNGGSAADAQHIAAELVIRYKADRAPIPAIALTTDSSALTACGNDLGFDAIFARQLNALGRSGDVALGISTSGNSRNVIEALQKAKEIGMTTIGLAGGDGGEMAAYCDLILVIPSRVTARIQEMHILVGHMLCKALEERLGLV